MVYSFTALTESVKLFGNRVSKSAVPDKGEIGCRFDEISNLVEPIERPSRGRADWVGTDGVVLPNGPADEEPGEAGLKSEKLAWV